MSLLVVCCSVFGSLNLTTVKLSGVGSSFQKHTDAESKGIKAHFNMDESGVLLLDRVSRIFFFFFSLMQLLHLTVGGPTTLPRSSTHLNHGLNPFLLYKTHWF